MLPTVHRREPWQIRAQPPHFRRYRALLLCATLVAAAGGLLMWGKPARHAVAPSVWNSFRTERGATQQITLRDGSTVLLNTDTELQVRDAQDRHSVRLIRGEALFRVAHDPNHALEVLVSNYTLRDVGTEFSVRLRGPQSVDVLVRDGSVEVDQEILVAGTTRLSSSPAPVIPVAELSRGDLLVVRTGTGKILKLSRSEVDRRLAWENGRLEFEGEPIADAVTEFNRYNNLQLEVSDPGIGAIRIGGTFDARNPEGFVSTLEKACAVEAQPAKDSGNVMLVRRDAH